MANKFIGCVEDDRGHITRLRVWNGAWSTVNRNTVVQEINDGTEYYTWYWNPKSAKYESGAQVHVVSVHRTPYLRTDRNEIAADNLGSLPDLTACPF